MSGAVASPSGWDAHAGWRRTYRPRPAVRTQMALGGVAVVLAGVVAVVAGQVAVGAVAVVLGVGLTAWLWVRAARARITVAPDGTMAVVDPLGRGGAVALPELRQVSLQHARVGPLRRRWFRLDDARGGQARFTAFWWEAEADLWRLIIDCAHASGAQVQHQAARVMSPSTTPAWPAGWTGRP